MESKRNLVIDDLVIMLDKNQTRGKWLGGMAFETIEETHGLVRSAWVMTKNGIYLQWWK